MTSDSNISTPAEDTTLTLESVQTICDRMFSARMLQIERMQEKSDRKIELMFEKLLNKQGPTVDVPNPPSEVPRELATVDNGLTLLQDTRKKRQKRNALPPPTTTNPIPNPNPNNIDSQPPQYNSMETDEDEKC